MKAWEDELYDESGGGRTFHILKFPADANYITLMSNWARSADGVNGIDGDTEKHKARVESRRIGKQPPIWAEREYWLRERFPAIKKAFQDRGDERRNVRTVEELGFDFDEYKKERDIEGKSLI